MLGSVLAIGAALTGLLVWWLRRRSERTPEQKRQERYDEVEGAVAEGDARWVNGYLERRLRDEGGDSAGRPGGGPPASE